ncbi:methylated-DNA--[protein]-cysteine S-methyltransferase [Hydrogenophaga sp. BPS33]|uniref:methylated-DNA--[protein]-cysteine S-methyltransferase n=1 Tax=Hydrogenophaga sp. BPS33 TaxID=2651974 RepID=UPI00131FF858|nr:methylated-DNA--[protein]-cysteine S-methyltransferase [Hydrogenophaga sp. BPS33]QHE87349.1 methylated-DNA--[protein]-cysteine S-methyltransferase [Hydrogenophaga sp. BPS33]
MKHDPLTVFTTWQGPLGAMVLAATPRGLSGVWFDGQRHGPDTSGWRRDPAHPVLLQAIEQLAQYFDGRRTQFELPLDLQGGTPFQQQVWQALLRIAPGDTTSYGSLSAAIGKPAAVRALGAAVGRNPMSIVVPCHRVLGANGSLTGYAGGLERKTALLSLEGARTLEAH